MDKEAVVHIHHGILLSQYFYSSLLTNTFPSLKNPKENIALIEKAEGEVEHI